MGRNNENSHVKGKTHLPTRISGRKVDRRLRPVWVGGRYRLGRRVERVERARHSGLWRRVAGTLVLALGACACLVLLAGWIWGWGL
jgi:hypothetical protein